MSILTTAEEIINGQRAKDYGDARENHERIANLWSYFKKVEFSPEDVAVMMILLKIARLMENGYHHDTMVDIAGYAGVLEKMQLPAEERYERREINFNVVVSDEKTRQWDSLYVTPYDAKVRDRDGDTYHHDGSNWQFHDRYTKVSRPLTPEESKNSGVLGPFVEIESE